MADEPVSAWREPLSRRARRWAQQNRTKVTAAAVALIAGVIGLSAILVVQTQAKTDIARALVNETRASRALAGANEGLGRSKAAVQARYELAVDAIKTFHTGVSEDFLLKEEKFKALRDRLLRSASDFYGKLGALLGKETDLASRRALAAANFELARLTAKVGRNADAMAAHRSVLEARRELASEPGADASARADVGRSLTEVAGLLELAGKTDEALAAYRQAEGVLSAPAAESPDARAALADCRSRMGFFLTTIGKDDQALAVYRLARADQEKLAAASGATPEARRNLGDTLNRIGRLLSNTGRPREADAEYRKALEIRRALAEENPALAELRTSLAASHNNLGLLLAADGAARGGGGRATQGPGDPAETRRREPRGLAVSRARGRQPLQPGHVAAGQGPAGGGGVRAAQGSGRVPGTGRGEPRRHRLPQHPGEHPRQPRPPAGEHGPAPGGGGRVS